MSSTVTTTLLGLLLAITTSCTKESSAGEGNAGAKARPQPTAKGDVIVELAGVTLGDNCGASWTPPPPKMKQSPAANKPTPARAAPSAPAESTSRVAADCDGPDCGGGYGRNNCQQTSIQLALHAKGVTSATPIKIKKVELLDAKGKSLGELTASTPTRWSDAGSYKAWDQNLAPGEQAAVSYVLSSPDWYAMEGGQYAQTGKTFQVRVTVVVGAKDKVVEKKAIQPAIMPPPVPT